MSGRRACCAARVVILAALVAGACDVNPYDATQEPRVTVTQGAAESTVTIGWQPDGAQLVRVYRGGVAGDGYGEALQWSIVAEGENSLRSAVRYGEEPLGGATDVPPRPLVAGQTYTVEVTRRDPRGSGDGFTNTRNRYVGVAVFTFRGEADGATRQGSVP
jgi:hypothetical protein